MSDIIDINISPVIETVALTIQPNLTTINVNTITGGGGAVDSVNGQIGVVVLDQDDVLDGTTYKQYSLTEKNKLAGIEAGAEVNVNADWNAVSGDALILNKPTIPSVTGFVPYTGATTDVDLGEFELKAGQVEFDQTPTGTAGVGVMRWNDTDGTLDLGLKGGNVTLQIGQEEVVRVVNKTATNVNLLQANYQAVRVTGAQGQRLKVDLAQATNDVLSAETIGLVTETINNNQEGFITTNGLVRGINTTGSLQGETWVDGDIVYLSATTAGNITNVKPLAPNHLVIIGYVVSAHITQGTIFVKVDVGYELDELHNVALSTPLNNQALTYETSTQLWKNKTIIEDAITDGVTDKAPSQNSVFDALATKFTLPALTSGSVLFSNGTTIAQDNANLFWNDTNNRLGIGTNAPTQSLDLVKEGAGAYFSSRTYRSSEFGGGFIFLHARGTVSSPTFLLQNDRVASVFFKGYDGTVANDGNSASIESFASLNHTSSDLKASLSFSVNNGGLGVTEVMRIVNGNVLIQNGGTFTDAGFRLDVNGTTRLNGSTSIGGSTAGARLDVRAQGALSTDIAFRVRNSADTANLVTVQGNGNVGIGTATPEGRLHTFYSNFSDVTILERTPSFNDALAGSAILRAGYTLSPLNGGGPSFSFQLRVSTTINDIASFGAAKDGADNSGYLSFATFNAGVQDVKMQVRANGNVIIQNGGTFTNLNSAILNVNSTTQGFLPPRMTTTQKNAIATPAAGLVVYDTTLGKLCVRTASAWETITSI